MGREPRDEIDELFGRLEPVAPPADFTQQVLARTVGARVPARRLWPEVVWGLLDLAALSVLAVLSISLGQALGESGGFEVLRAAAENLELLVDARVDFLLAVADTLPWLHLAGLLLNLVVVYVLSRTFVGGLFGPSGAGRGQVERR